MLVFKVSIWNKESSFGDFPDTIYTVTAKDDVQARAKAIKLDDNVEKELSENPRPTSKRVSYCKIEPICELDGE